MKRLAAHRICFSAGACFDIFWIGLDDNGTLRQLAPLEDEIAATVFLNGLILMVPAGQYASPEEAEEQFNRYITRHPRRKLTEFLEETGLTTPPSIGRRYYPLHLENFDFPASELRADNSRGNCHVKRL